VKRFIRQLVVNCPYNVKEGVEQKGVCPERSYFLWYGPDRVDLLHIALNAPTCYGMVPTGVDLVRIVDLHQFRIQVRARTVLRSTGTV
jgi:hypothetical protein